MLEPRSLNKDEQLLIDKRLYEVWFSGTKLSLTATEYDLLILLHTEKDRVLSRLEILEKVWGRSGKGFRVVDTYVSRLRTKLRMVGHPGVISIRKRGYRLAGVSTADINRPPNDEDLDLEEVQ